MTLDPTIKTQQLQQLAIVTDIVEQNLPWEYRIGSEWYPNSRSIHPFTALYNGHEIRIKPTPTLIPLEAADIPPGSVFKKAYDSAIYTANCIAEGKIYLADTICFTATYISMVDDWLINRSIPLLGKWDPTAWEPCSKPK